MFSCCTSDDGQYEGLRQEGNMDKIDETKRGMDEMTSSELKEFAEEADLHIAETEAVVVEVVEEKIVEVEIDVIADAEDTNPDAPPPDWGTGRVLAFLRGIEAGAEKKRKEQAKVAKVLKRLVELCEAKEPALQVLADGGLNLMLSLLVRFEGLVSIQAHVCNAIQFLCARPEADTFDFPELGAQPLKDVAVASKQSMPTLISALDSLSVFTRVSEEYIQSAIDCGTIAEIFDMLRSNMNKSQDTSDAFKLQISLTRVVVSLSRSPSGRQALGAESIGLLLDSMRVYKDIQNLVGNCTEALWYLCLDTENCFRMLDQDVTVLLTDTMRDKYVGQDLHTKIITLLHQLISQEGVPDRFVEDGRGVELLSELLIDNETVSENYIVILQVWITLLAHASENTRIQVLDDTFIQRRVVTLAPVLTCDEQEAREAALTLLLIVLQTNSQAVELLARDPDMLSGLLGVTQFPMSGDALQCLMVIYFRLCASFDTQAVLFNGEIMSFMATVPKFPELSSEAVKSAAATLLRLYANQNYHQELDDKVSDLKQLVALRMQFPEAEDILNELDASLDRVRQANSVYVTVSAPMDDMKELEGEGEGAALKGPASVNVKLSVGQEVQVYSKSQDLWVDGKIRDIADRRICVVYGNREKWLKETSKQWRPKENEIVQAARTRSGATARRAPEEKDVNQGPDEEPSQDYADEPGAATEMLLPDVPLDFNADAVIEGAANRRLESPRPPESTLARPATRRATIAAANEMDYDVVFVDKKLGLELRPGENNKNCVVSQCLSDFTNERIDPEAYIVQVNGLWVKDLEFDTIYQIIVNATKHPPLTIMFRSQKDDDDNAMINALEDNTAAGTLKIHVVEAMQLLTRARYAKVKLLGDKQQTSMVAPSVNPEWPDTLIFPNFRPGSADTATVVIYSQNRLLKDNKVGSATFSLPTTFYKLERHNQLELLDKKDKLAGSVSVTAILTRSTDRESHRLRAAAQFSMPPGESIMVSDAEE